MEKEPTDTIITELISMSEADQAMRDAYQTTDKWDENVDISNTARLKEIIDQHGWPTKSLVGKKASSAAWILAQHADKDRAFQANCLQLMKEQPETEVVLWQIALFEDRVRMNDGRPQLYATQFRMKDGVFGPGPVEDEEHLEERRAAMGLETYEEYSREMREMYDEHQASIMK